MAGFKITRGKGFHITFENGCTMSVQFGPGNYADNYRASLNAPQREDYESTTAETASWDAENNWLFPEQVKARQTPAQVLADLVSLASRERDQ